MSQAPTVTKAPASTPVTLSVMMFLQYAVWGVWLPYLANYLQAPTGAGGLGFTGGQIGWILGLAGSIGAVSAPFIAGQIADRIMNAERALAMLLLVGGVLKFVTAFVSDYHTFMLLSILYSIAYMPTLSLTNSICFQNLRDPEKTFPPIRLWGTIGWIVASVAFPFFWLNAPDAVTNTHRIADSLKVAGVASIAYAAFSLLMLPKTPPKKDVEHPLAFARAFELLTHPDFLLVTLIALPIAMIHQCYFFRAGPYFEDAIGISKQYLGAVMGIGQASEIFFLVILGLLIKRLGYKGVLILGALAYAARFAIFAVQSPHAVVIAAQSLHGLCYGCFFAGSFLYVEKVAPKDARHSAQTVFGIIILGLGPVLAGFYNQYFDRFKVKLAEARPHIEGVTSVPLYAQVYTQFWWTQAAIAVACALILALAFKPKAQPVDSTA